MSWIDWGIVLIFLVAMVSLALSCKKYTKSVADFLAANRCAGRYLLAVSGDASSLGAISVLAWYELYYNGGLSAAWWAIMLLPLNVVIALSGWVLYRYRQTRAMTVAQFFEIRYSKKLRVFAGILAYLSGILNFGIFPAVGANFFIYFCSLPPSVSFLGLHISTFALVMAILLIISLFFTYVGGQIAVAATDFFEGLFTVVVFILMIGYILYRFSWDEIGQTLMTAPADASLVNPFHTSQMKDFGFWFFGITVITTFYSVLSWQGSQGYYCSALNPHEARMGRILSTWRIMAKSLVFIMVPIAIYVIMHNSNYSSMAASVSEELSRIDNPTIQTQMLVPIGSKAFLPKGLLGMMCAMMLAAFISNLDTYLHSWGSIFIQDVVMPFNKKQLSPQTHLKFLRASVTGVAIFVFFFSLFFPQKQYILMWFYITGAIYLAGSGSVIIGGLYWKKATAQGAWCALITGAVLSIVGIIIRQLNPGFFMNGQQLGFAAMLCAIVIFIIVSLLTCKEDFNLDKMLHRGKYAIADDNRVETQAISIDLKEWFYQRLGITKEFTPRDKWVYFGSITWTISWFGVFVTGTVCNLLYEVSDRSWLNFWFVYIVVNFVVLILFAVWYGIGGFFDIKRMFKKLRSTERNDMDNGTVINHHNLEEKVKT